MPASNTKVLPYYEPGNDANVIELPIQEPSQIVLLEREYLELKCAVGYWQKMHQKAVLRENALKQIVKEQEGKIRDLQSRLFGKKSETGNPSKTEGQKGPETKKRPRGQQPGSKGHGRTVRPDLPEREEEANFPETPVCTKCGQAYVLDGNKEAEIHEVEVKAYTRWENVLLNKFHYCQPTNRLLNQYSELALPISPGSIAGGLKIIKGLFEPVYDAFYDRQMTEDRFHNMDQEACGVLSWRRLCFRSFKPLR